MTQVQTTTVEQYLDYDDSADCRTEFHDGEIFRIDDLTFQHATIQKNLLIALGVRMATKPCAPIGPARFHAIAKEFVNPDIFVICGPPEYTADRRSMTNPTMVVEILSPSTADYEFELAAEVYRQMRTLREYVLVSQESALVDVYRRTQEGNWLLTSYRGLAAEVPFESVGVSAHMTEIYAGLDLSQA